MRGRRRPPGPLAPWRFALSVAGSAVTTGPQLAAATSSGDHLDLALGRSIVAAAAMWVVLGAISRTLGNAAAGVDGAALATHAADGSADPAGDPRTDDLTA